jgi:hypothetical protein
MRWGRCFRFSRATRAWSLERLSSARLDIAVNAITGRNLESRGCGCDGRCDGGRGYWDGDSLCGTFVSRTSTPVSRVLPTRFAGTLNGTLLGWIRQKVSRKVEWPAYTDDGGFGARVSTALQKNTGEGAWRRVPCAALCCAALVRCSMAPGYQYSTIVHGV